MKLFKGATGDDSVHVFGWFDTIEEAIKSFQEEYDENDEYDEDFEFSTEYVKEIKPEVKGVFHYAMSI